MTLQKIGAGLLGVVILGAIGSACQGDASSTSSAPSAAIPAVTSAPTTTVAAAPPTAVTVTRVATIADLTLSDGRSLHLSLMDHDPACDAKVKLPAARKLLVGKEVTVTAPLYGGGDPEVTLPDGRQYYSAMLSEASNEVYEQCYGADSATTTTAPGSDTDVTIEHGDDDGLPDGALTGGFCRRHRWC